MDNNDASLITLLASSSASLAEVPGKNNWIERADGNLPPYVRKLVRGIMKSGKSKSQAIAIAISRAKAWAAGGDDVDADTRAKAAKAVAQWEALKAKNSAKKLVKASGPDGSSYIMLTNVGSFNTDMVRRAWNAFTRSDSPLAVGEESSGYIAELWTDHIIVERYGKEPTFVRVPYSVSGSDVVFGEETPVEHAWVEVDDSLTPAEEALLSDIFARSSRDPLARIRKIAQLG